LQSASMKKKILASSSSFFLLCLLFIPNILGTNKIFPYQVGRDHLVEQMAATSGRETFVNSQVSITVAVSNCAAWGYCDHVPQLNFTLNNSSDDGEQYILYVLVDDTSYEFEENHGQINVEVTPKEGVQVTYWAESATSALTLPESSFRMRYFSSKDKYIFQLLGEQWADEIPGGALVWDMFPSMELTESGWAQQIKKADDLYTTVDYTLLAGRLIWEGIVEPEDCPNRGLLANGAADTCGLKAAREWVIDWQNKHNEEILEAAISAHVPPRLLKGVIAQESQFYPNWNFPEEYGLGMLTEHGVDMLLQWNETFYLDKCGLIYSANYCRNGYLNITTKQKAELIGYVLQEIGTDKEFQVLAQALYAACYQASYIVSYYTDRDPSQVTDYETMWRIALGIYHAGFGCMSDGVSAGWRGGAKRLEWNNISPYLIGDCVSAADYFDKVANYSK
jgi:hypothetical protein